MQIISEGAVTTIYVTLSADVTAGTDRIAYGNNWPRTLNEYYQVVCDDIAWSKQQIAKFGWKTRGYFPPALPILTMRCTARPAHAIRIRRPRTRAPRRAPYLVTR